MKRILTISLVTMMFCIVACDKTENTNRPYIPHDPNKEVEILNFEPKSGQCGRAMIIEGSNFGTDATKIKVFFGNREGKVTGSNGTRIGVMIPARAGSEITVVINGKTWEAPMLYTHNAVPYVTTYTNPNGTTSFDFGDGTINTIKFRPTYMSVFENYLFVTTFNAPTTPLNLGQTLLQIDLETGKVRMLANRLDHGFEDQCTPYRVPYGMGLEREGVILSGTRGARDRFLTLDPKDDYNPKVNMILKWVPNGYKIPPATGADSDHIFLMRCPKNGRYYTRYASGQIVEIDLHTWEARVVGLTPQGNPYGYTFHPVTGELWLAYNSGQGGWAQNAITALDVTDEEPWDGTNNDKIPSGGSTTNNSGEYYKGEEFANEIRILRTFRKITRPTFNDGGAYRDGPSSEARFNAIRGISFDENRPYPNLFLADMNNACIRKFNTREDIITTYIGRQGEASYKDGDPGDARFNQPHGIVVDQYGIIYLSDHNNYRIRRISED